MNPFTHSQAGAKLSLPGRLVARPALIVFLLCLAVGLAVVAWRAHARRQTAAHSAAASYGQAIARQLNQVVTAAEALGAAARYGGAAVDFQKVATELSAAHPGLGVTVLRDPAQSPGGTEAYRTRKLTVGLLDLGRGARGIVAQAPVFQRGRDGRDAFWGLVAVWLRLPDALARAQVDDLARQGYKFALYLPANGQQKAQLIANNGAWPLEGAVRQAVKVQNLELSFDVRRSGAWADYARAGIESLGVLCLSALLCLMVNLLESRSSLEVALADVNQRLTRETADHARAEEECRNAKDAAAAAQAGFNQTRADFQQVQGKVTELQSRYEATVREASEAGKAAQARLQQAEEAARSMQARLKSSVQAAEEAVQARQKELEETRAALEQARQAMAEMKTQLAAVAQADQQVSVAQAQRKQDLATIADLQARLDTAQAELGASVAAQARFAKDQTTIADLQARLEAGARSAQKAAESGAARVAELEQTNSDLKARLLAAERAQARVAELAELLEETQTELQRHRQAAQSAGPVAEAETGHRISAKAEEDKNDKGAAADPPAEVQPAVVVAAVLAEKEVAPAVMLPERGPASEEPKPLTTPAAPSAEQPAAENAAPAQLDPPTAPKERADEPPAPAPESQPEPSPKVPVLAAEAEPSASTTPVSASLTTAENSSAAAAEPPAKQKQPKAARRKKVRREEQTDLFCALSPADQPADGPAVQSDLSDAAPPRLAEPASPPAGSDDQQLAGKDAGAPSELPAKDAVIASDAAVEPVVPPAAITAEAEAPAGKDPVPVTKEPEVLPDVPALPASEVLSAVDTVLSIPTPTPELPAIEGVDTAAGLAHADGSPKLYLKALRHFGEQQAGAPERIRDALLQGDPAAALRALQTLASAADEIGAIVASQTAAILARTIQEQADPAEIESLWAELEKVLGELVAELKRVSQPKEDKPAPARRLPPAPPLNPALLRKAISQIVPLLADGDPGAKDCLKDNRTTFRSAFSPEAYAEFEQLVKSADFAAALEHLRKAAKKHGIAVA